MTMTGSSAEEEERMDRKTETEGRYAYFSHRECEYFPCHPGADPENFNCLFCYCPLYMLGRHCGGNFRYTEKGIKDCTQCLIPHDRANYRKITGRFRELADLLSELDGSSEKP